MEKFRSIKFFVLAVMFIFTVNSYAQKMTAADVIAKHLDSIGAKELRDQVKNHIVIGETTVNFITQKTPSLVGKIVLVSEGNKNFFGLKFDSTDYPTERFSFDGKDGKVGLVKTGVRSILGNFITANEVIIEDGLLGGTLSSAWSLIDPASKKAKISFDGTKKLNGKEVYVLGYSPKGGADLNIKMFFDKETFQHVRTEYKRVSSAGIGLTPDQSSQFYETRISLTEEFSDFKPESNITLPHKYRLFYSISGQRGTTEIEWLFDLKEFGFNQNLDPNTFVIEAN